MFINGIIASGGLRHRIVPIITGPNILTNPRDFTNVVWVKSSGTTISADSTTDIYGTALADKIVSGSGTAIWRVTQTITKTAVSKNYRFSFYCKQAGFTQCAWVAASTSVGVYSFLDINAGTTLPSFGAYGSGYTFTSQGITAAANGFFLITCDFTSNNETYIDMIIECAASEAESIAGDSVKGIYVDEASLIEL